MKVHAREIRAFRRTKAEQAAEARREALEIARKEIGKNAFSKESRTSPQSKETTTIYGQCKVCGAEIPKTGKRGRPPQKCERCK
jgi:RNA polymerase-binding transcription factor DksA